MRFCFPWMLLLLPVFAALAIAAFVLLRRGNTRLTLFATPSILRRAGLVSKGGRGGADAIRFSPIPFVQLTLLMVGMMLLAVAAARPQWGKADVMQASRGRSLLIALDVSRSMLASDVHPNRLERAKVDILDLIADLRGDRAGILVFRGKGLMLCPLTTDYAFLRQAVDGISIDSAPRGETDIADAISKCLEGLKEASLDNTAILLISDGEDLAGRAQRLAKTAGERGIPIFTVGIGDTSGANVPAQDGKGVMKFGGKEVKSRLTESTLREIANASGGIYIPLATSGTASTTLGAIYRQHLTRIAAEEFEEMLANRFVERYQLFLIPALVLLLVAAMLSKGRPSSPRRAAKAAVLLLILAPSLLLADNATPPVQTSTRDLRTTFNEAVDAYLQGDTTNTAAILLPISNRRDFPQAAELYAAAEFEKSFDPALATNAAGRIEHLSKAATAFQTSLSGSPNDERQVRNLNRAIMALPALREEARINAVLAKEGKTPVPQLIARMLNNQREIYEKHEALATNSNASLRIEGLENLAEKQKATRDLWVVLKPALTNPQVLTNEAHRMEMEKAVDEMQGRMMRLTDALSDLDPQAAELATLSENDIFNLWFMTAEPPALIDEDILLETNVVESPLAPKWKARESSATALALTKSFAERFPKWAENYIQQDAQRRQQEGSTNAPTFTEENVAKINELLEPLLWVQQDNCKVTNLLERTTGATQALDLLYKIRDLLPKDGNGGGSSQNQSQSQASPKEQNQEQQKQENENQENSPEEQEEQKQEEQAAKEENEEPPADVQEDLRKALQREREHEAEKQRQRREYPMSPNTRDW